MSDLVSEITNLLLAFMGGGVTCSYLHTLRDRKVRKAQCSEREKLLQELLRSIPVPKSPSGVSRPQRSLVP